MRREIGKLLAYLSEAFPAFKPTARTAAVWADALEGYDERALMGAARALARGGSKVMPSTAEVVAALRGREVRVPVHHRDAWGSVPLDRNGVPSVVAWETVLVPPGIAPPSHLLSWGDDENEQLLGACSIAPHEEPDRLEPAPQALALPEMSDGS